MTMSAKEQVEALLLREAELVDSKSWQEWLDLMSPEIEYWVPAWEQDEPTSNPESELSLIYYSSRQGLEDRVFRIRSARSAASNPMPRTCHYVTNIRCDFSEPNVCKVKANWQVNSWRDGATTSFWGRYEYVLGRAPAGGWWIERKKIILMNDLIPVVLDIYLL